MYPSEFTLETILTFLKNYPGCLFMKDEKGCYIFASEVCQHVNGDVPGGILGKNELEVQKDIKLGRQYYEEDMRILSEGGEHKGYSEFKTEDGSLYYEINKSAVKDGEGKIIGIIGTVVEVTNELEMQKQIKKQLITDAVTGVYNNRYLELWIEHEQPIYPFSVIACDCNFLKRVNDTFGHEYGDLLLKSAGQLFLDYLPENCIPIRVGGDEFLILCNHTTDAEAKMLINELTVQAQSKHIKGGNLSISYGSCTMCNGEMSFEECRKYADSHMYESKQKMKASYLKKTDKINLVYNQEMFVKIVSQMPVIVFFKDTDCRYQYLNAYDERVMWEGNKMNYGIGHTDCELQRDPELGKAAYEDDLRILRTGRGSNRTRMIMLDDLGRYYQIIKSAVRDEADKIVGIVGIVMDVTLVESGVNSITDLSAPAYSASLMQSRMPVETGRS